MFFEEINIATDKRGYPRNIFLFLHKNICCGYSLEAPWQNKYCFVLFYKQEQHRDHCPVAVLALASSSSTMFKYVSLSVSQTARLLG